MARNLQLDYTIVILYPNFGILLTDTDADFSMFISSFGCSLELLSFFELFLVKNPGNVFILLIANRNAADGD
jgi:hypothetical protein